ncbi:hypothetical protein [uncultured Ruminococcus sp.]|uniref:hypothetical protein n=1 Tax=uncultured Ruminococcus sp. TaxID=165186 RepID=UPI0025E987CD|nr:hypothetical protein [uncultured Ruminococcus sp.]
MESDFEMNLPFSRTYKYDIKSDKQNFLNKLRKCTVKENTACEQQTESDFIGNITDNDFTVKAVPSSKRRGLFNPTIYGCFVNENNKTKLSVTMKCSQFDYIFLALFFVVCVFFGWIIYMQSLENISLTYLIFPLPFAIFIVINILFIAIANLNFRDARERLEKTIFK